MPNAPETAASRAAREWVQSHSPERGGALALHLAMADAIDDDGLVRLSLTQLGAATHTARSLASAWAWDAVDRGLLEAVEDNRGTGRPTVFRVLTPVLVDSAGT